MCKRQSVLVLLVISLVAFVLEGSFVSGQGLKVGNSGKTVLVDSVIPGKGNREQQIKQIDDAKVRQLSDSSVKVSDKSSLVDTTVKNKYGDLLNDDSMYTKKRKVWLPMGETVLANVFVWSIDRVLLNASFARIGPATWKYNLKNGWEWDADRFGVNFIGHPYSGTISFNAGRSNGYNYLQSSAFAVGGSLMWEYFCEDTRPSYNDIINTPVNGAFLGEIMYRLSSNILDDRTRGFERFSRELLAGIVDPMRGFNRLISGKMSRRTNVEIYQKEPLNVSLYAGIHKINVINKEVFGQGSTSEMVNVQFDYGNPFELRSRKPFDFFKLRAEFDFGVGRKILSNVTGYGILTGKNLKFKKHSILLGLFQYSDYWDNKTFELGAIAFGGGIFSNLPLSKTSALYTNVHVGIIPFAGNSTHFGPDTSQVRDYDFGNGLAGKFEMTLTIGHYASASLIYYYYMIRTYVGAPGDNYIGIFKPRLMIGVFKNVSLGFEHYVYYNNRYLKDRPPIHLTRTEQKIFVLIYLEDKQRRGHYN